MPTKSLILSTKTKTTTTNKSIRGRKILRRRDQEEIKGQTEKSRMKSVQKAFSLFLKTINYSGQVDRDTDKGLQTDNYNGGGSRSSSRRPPSAPSQRKPPVIRIRRERSLNGVMWGSPQQMTDSANTTIDLVPATASPTTAATAAATVPRRSRKRQNQKQQKYKQQQQEEPSYSQTLTQPLQQQSINMGNHIDSGNHLKVDERSRHRSHSNDSKHSNRGGKGGSSENLTYSPEAEKFVRAAIDKSRPVERQVIRIINGNDPTVQSQVLLNTKTSQPWEDLVKDLGMAVKLPKKRDCQMETISGRRIQSYSQLRSELQAGGNQAFYVYCGREDYMDLGLPSLSHQNRRISLQAQRLSENLNKKFTYSDTALPVIQLQNNHHHNNNNNNNNLNIRNQNHTQKSAKASSMMIIPQNDYSTSNENIPSINRKSSMKASASTANLATTTSKTSVAIINNNHRLSTGNLNNNNNYLSTSSINVKDQSSMTSKSNTNLLQPQQQQRNRSTRRRRSEASVYLASASRSRSVSP